MNGVKKLLEERNNATAADMDWGSIGGFFEATKRLLRCYGAVTRRISFKPEIGIVLGSGLGGLVEVTEVAERLPYHEIPDFPKSTVDGHKGEYVFGRLGGKNVVLMNGRVHYYEGYSMEDVVLPVRLLSLLGAKKVILTNAAGGINPGFKPGTLMNISDHISSFVPSPLIGPNDILGTRFPDMSEVYSKELQRKLHETAEKNGIELADGVYLQTTGPNYETPSEVRMYGLLGADAVGMSTACEAMALNHMEVEVCGISCITNMASGISAKPLSHSEVKETADRVADSFEKLVNEFVKAL